MRPDTFYQFNHIRVSSIHKLYGHRIGITKSKQAEHCRREMNSGTDLSQSPPTRNEALGVAAHITESPIPQRARDYARKNLTFSEYVRMEAEKKRSNTSEDHDIPCRTPGTEPVTVGNHSSTTTHSPQLFEKVNIPPSSSQATCGSEDGTSSGRSSTECLYDFKALNKQTKGLIKTEISELESCFLELPDVLSEMSSGKGYLRGIQLATKALIIRNEQEKYGARINTVYLSVRSRSENQR